MIKEYIGRATKINTPDEYWPHRRLNQLLRKLNVITLSQYINFMRERFPKQ